MSLFSQSFHFSLCICYHFSVGNYHSLSLGHHSPFALYLPDELVIWLRRFENVWLHGRIWEQLYRLDLVRVIGARSVLIPVVVQLYGQELKQMRNLRCRVIGMITSSEARLLLGWTIDLSFELEWSLCLGGRSCSFVIAIVG